MCGRNFNALVDRDRHLRPYRTVQAFGVPYLTDRVWIDRRPFAGRCPLAVLRGILVPHLVSEASPGLQSSQAFLSDDAQLPLSLVLAFL